MRPRSRDIGLVVGIGAAALLFWYARIIEPARGAPPYPDLSNLDPFTYTAPVLASAAETMRGGSLPLWNPYQALGHPALAPMPAGVLYPLNAPFLVLPPHLAIELVVVLHLFLAGAFMYVYARSALLGREGATAAALGFMMSGSVAVRAAYSLPTISACVWLPLAFLAVDRIFERPGFRWVVLLAAAVAMPLLAGWPQLWTYSMYAVGLYATARWIAVALRAPERARAPLLLLAAAGVLGLGLAAIQLLPTHELQALTDRGARAIGDDRALLFGAIKPSALLAAALDPTPAFPRYVYLGVAAPLLIPLALLARTGRLRVACLFVLGLLGILVALTVFTPVYDWFLAFPGGSWFRLPTRILYLYAFSGSLLIGIGLDAVARSMEEGSMRRARVAVSCATAIAVLLVASVGMPLAAVLLLAATSLLLWLFVLLPSRRQRRAALAGLVALLAWDLFHAAENRSPHPIHHPHLAEVQDEVLAFVARRQGLHRTYFDTEPLDLVMMPKQATRMGIYGISDYEPLSLRRYGRWLRALDDNDLESLERLPFYGRLTLDPESPRLHLLDLMGVRHAVLRRSSHALRERLGAGPAPWSKVFAPPRSDYVVYENPAVLPRAFVAFDAVHARSEDEAFRALMEGEVDPRRTVVLEGVSETPARVTETAAVLARILAYAPREVVIESNAPRPGYLVLTDTFYPGWRATVDGVERPILTADYLFRAVEVEAGPRRVVFRYEPRSYRAGRALTLLALLAVAVVPVARRLLASRRGAGVGVA